MVAGLEDGGNGVGVFIERGVYVAVGDKSGEVEPFPQVHCGGRPLQTVGCRPAAMSADAVARAAKRHQCGHLTESEVGVHHEPHAEAQSIATKREILQRTEFPYLRVERIEVIACAVAAREERFAGILRPHQPYLHIVAITERVFQPVLVFVSQIAVAVALAIVEGHAGCGDKLMPAIFEDVSKSWEAFFLRVSEVGEILQQLALIPVQTLYHGQFAP